MLFVFYKYVVIPRSLWVSLMNIPIKLQIHPKENNSHCDKFDVNRRWADILQNSYPSQENPVVMEINLPGHMIR